MQVQSIPESDERREIVILNPSKEFCRQIINKYNSKNEIKEHITICAERKVLNSIKTEFKLSTIAANLVESGNLTFRRLKSDISGTVVQIVDKIYTVIESGSDFELLNIKQESDVNEKIEQVLSASAAYEFNSVSWDTLYSTLENQLGEKVARDYHYVIENVSTFDNGVNKLNEISAILLVAGHHGILLYHVSEWADSCEIASKAMVSQKKIQLEEEGFLKSDTVETLGRGRPRLKLELPQNMYEEKYDIDVIKQLQEIIM